MASDRAFTGPADEGSELPNIERLRDCSGQGGRTELWAKCVPHTTLEGAGGCTVASHPVLSST